MRGAAVPAHHARMEDEQPDRERIERARRANRKEERIEAAGRALGAVVAAPFVVGVGLLQAALYGAVWLLGLGVLAGAGWLVWRAL